MCVAAWHDDDDDDDDNEEEAFLPEISLVSCMYLFLLYTGCAM